MELIKNIIQALKEIFFLIIEILALIKHHLIPDGVIHLDWGTLTVGILALFAFIGFKKGWQYGMATLAAHFFAWGMTTEATGYLIRIAKAITERPITAQSNPYFPIIVYLFLVVMVMVAFSQFIDKEPKKTNEKVASLAMGALSGYFFLVLLFDTGHQWIANRFTSVDPLVNLQLTVDSLFSLTILSDFTNNPYIAYENLLTVESVILLLLLFVFWTYFFLSFFTWVKNKLTPQ